MPTSTARRRCRRAEPRRARPRPSGLHRYEPHAEDWRPGDPTWRGGKGKGIIGALNYLAGKGDEHRLLPDDERRRRRQGRLAVDRPDSATASTCSKLDQWEIVFSHMDRLGLALHVITQETGERPAARRRRAGPERKLYYRELVARFGHHLALVWNLGEENTNTDAQRKAFAAYIHAAGPLPAPDRRPHLSRASTTRSTRRCWAIRTSTGHRCRWATCGRRTRRR